DTFETTKTSITATGDSETMKKENILPIHPCVGNVKATLTVYDSYGAHITVTKVGTVVDTTAPKLEITVSPGDKYITTRTSATFNWCVNSHTTVYATAMDECSTFSIHWKFKGDDFTENVDNRIWKLNDGNGTNVNTDGVYNLLFIATQTNSSEFGGMKFSKIEGTLTIDTKDPTVSVFATKVCASDTLHVRYTATDLHFKSAILSVDSTYVEFNGSTEVSVSAGENQTRSFKFEPTDRATVVVKIEAVDECGNTNHTSYATTVDNIFGGIEFGVVKPDKPTTIATFNGTITDLSGVCTVASYLVHNLGEGNATLTIKLLNYSKCESTQVTFKATVEVVETDATDVKVIIRATDCCCCSNPGGCDCNDVSRNSTTATLTITLDSKVGYATRTVEEEPPAITSTRTCKSTVTFYGTATDNSGISTYTATFDPVSAEVVDKDYEYDNGRWVATVVFDNTDRVEETSTITVEDEYGNATEIVATMIVDTMFRSIEYNKGSDVATSGNTEVTFNGTLTDLSSICEATVTSATAVSNSSGTYSITVEATLKDAEGCVATQATFEGTVSVEGEVEGIATITVVGTDCCCGVGCHSSNVIFTILIDTMPPSRTYGPEVLTDTDVATVNIGFHEEATRCNTYLATMTYHVTDGVDKNYTATSNIFTVDDNMLHIRFDPATSAASMTKATITYTGICDDYGNGPTGETSITWTKQ
ncbi:MAG: hypothetical protein J7L28_04840, partial [Thermotogae bacterium]|nr:hypothetical protein [Thermotogota bacterium]